MNAPAPIVGEVVPPETESPIVEYSATAAGLADLQSRFIGARFDCATSSGMKAATAARRELRTLRTNLEDLRQRLKAPILERGRLLDAEAKRITAAIVELEQPIDDQIRAEEKRREDEREARERAESERVAAIAQRIEWIRGRFVEAVRTGADVDALDAMVRDVESLPITPELYAERINEAENARTQTALELRELAGRMRAQAEERARLERERAEFEAERAAERARAEREAAERLERLERERVERAERESREARERARAELERIADPWGALDTIEAQLNSGDDWETVRQAIRNTIGQTRAARFEIDPGALQSHACRYA